MDASEITLAISDLGSGGAQRVLTSLANAWAERGRRVCVITYADESHDFFPLHKSVRRMVAGGMHESKHSIDAVRMNIKRILNLRRCIRESGAPVVVSFVGTTNIQTLFAAWGLGIRLVISERNDPARQSLGRFWDLMRRRFYRRADCVTANSRGALDTLSKFVPESKLAYVPNPLSVPPEESGSASRELMVLAAGRLYRQKAYDVLLPAFAQAVSNHPGWRLEILGDGPLRDDLRRQAAELEIADRVVWHGQVKNTFPFYRSASIFVLASRHEGMPNVMLEAMSSGLPVIVTDASPGPLEYIDGKQTGLIVPVEDIQSLAHALCRMMDDADLRDSLGQNAMERVSDCELSSVLRVWERVIGWRDP